GRLNKAEKLEVQVIETRKTKLGVDYLNILTSINNLAFTWRGNSKEIKTVRLMKNYIRV
ncbi:hypothetical protein DL98DRAFT_441482, partial [Cadophora sp. DSE1049]